MIRRMRPYRTSRGNMAGDGALLPGEIRWDRENGTMLYSDPVANTLALGSEWTLPGGKVPGSVVLFCEPLEGGSPGVLVPGQAGSAAVAVLWSTGDLTIGSVNMPLTLSGAEAGKRYWVMVWRCVGADDPTPIGLDAFYSEVLSRSVILTNFTPTCADLVGSGLRVLDTTAGFSPPFSTAPMRAVIGDRATLESLKVDAWAAEALPAHLFSKISQNWWMLSCPQAHRRLVVPQFDAVVAYPHSNSLLGATLRINGSMIREVDFSAGVALESEVISVDLSNNQIESLDLSPLSTKLVGFDVSGNPLTSLIATGYDGVSSGAGWGSVYSSSGDALGALWGTSLEGPALEAFYTSLAPVSYPYLLAIDNPLNPGGADRVPGWNSADHSIATAKGYTIFGGA